ncbi:MAG TPA: HAMP domain-containing sensor histidine kinase [Solirubrobacteraceae bacterium]|nr:HAMP domain-containing sensor histidine kinase [Solirubrobacteraceae bacterium]
MTRAALLVTAGLAAVTALIAVTDGAHAALVTGAALAVSAAAALAAARWAARRRRRVGPLGRQFALAVAIMVGQSLLAVVVVARLMFVSDDDAILVSLIVAFTGLVAVLAAQILAGGVLGDVEHVRDALVAVGNGERDVRITTAGGDELAELAAAANEMIRRLDEEERARSAAEDARRTLVAAVSHDLRTPMTSLRLLADAVSDGLVDETTRAEYLQRMTTHLGVLSTLIDDLFELSRIEAGDIRWSMEQVRLDGLVEEAVGAMRADGEARGVQLVAEVDRPLVAARANAEKLQRVLFNLIQNAIRHTPADGSVTVRGRTVGDGVELEVADTGEGIPAEDRGHVFDTLYRGGEQAARTEDGAGLGLAIARAIVEAHGGRIWLADQPQGTCVRLSLPA